MKKLAAFFVSFLILNYGFTLSCSAEVNDSANIEQMTNYYIVSLGLNATANIRTNMQKNHLLELRITPAAEKLYLDDIRAFFQKYKLDESLVQVVKTDDPLPSDFPESETDYLPYKEEKRGFRFGDIDGNRIVDLSDVQQTLKGYTTGMINGRQYQAITGEERWFLAMDVDRNYETDLKDAQHILRYYTLNTLGQRDVSWVDIVVFGA